jgi:hypothetical protein
MRAELARKRSELARKRAELVWKLAAPSHRVSQQNKRRELIIDVMLFENVRWREPKQRSDRPATAARTNRASSALAVPAAELVARRRKHGARLAPPPPTR